MDALLIAPPGGLARSEKLTHELVWRQTRAVTVSRPPTRRLAVAAFAVTVMAALLSVQPTSALTCANEWGGDTFAGAQEAVAHPERTDGLLVATIAAVERKDDYWRTRVLVVEPRVVFSGDLRGTLRVAIGGHGPDMAFATGATYFLALTRSVDAGTTEWFVGPCAPNMQITSGDQLTQLRAISNTDVVISEPVVLARPPRCGSPLPQASSPLPGCGLCAVVRRRHRSPAEKPAACVRSTQALSLRPQDRSQVMLTAYRGRAVTHVTNPAIPALAAAATHATQASQGTT